MSQLQCAECKWIKKDNCANSRNLVAQWAQVPHACSPHKAADLCPSVPIILSTCRLSYHCPIIFHVQTDISIYEYICLVMFSVCPIIADAVVFQMMLLPFMYVNDRNWNWNCYCCCSVICDVPCSIYLIISTLSGSTHKATICNASLSPKAIRACCGLAQTHNILST